MRHACDYFLARPNEHGRDDIAQDGQVHTLLAKYIENLSGAEFPACDDYAARRMGG